MIKYLDICLKDNNIINDIPWCQMPLNEAIELIKTTTIWEFINLKKFRRYPKELYVVCISKIQNNACFNQIIKELSIR